MRLKINVHLAYELMRSTDLLLQVEVAALADQIVRDRSLDICDLDHFATIPAEHSIGERAWIRASGAFQCTYSTLVDVTRADIDVADLPAVPPHQLPAETVRHLMPSRFCPSDLFQSFVAAEFGTLMGGARIAAMRDWINRAIAYTPGSSDAETTALDTFVQRRGVCRDFAHVMVTLARASSIPARFVSVYAPDVEPQDFHAVAEVYLDGDWRLIDATGMAPASTIARIGVGADASECAFLSAFGAMTLIEQSVRVARA